MVMTPATHGLTHIMIRQSKKDKEFTILRGIYRKKRFPKYTALEKPDFILHGKEDFGVEITEYYPDETVARLHNMPNYAEMITDKTYIHKDDREKLEVVTMEYQDKKSEKWIKMDAPAVRQENKTAPERIVRLMQQIVAKSVLINTYDSSLKDIDLVVHDSRSSLLNGVDDAFVRQALRNFQQSGTFSASRFRSIYVSIPPTTSTSFEVIQVK